MSERNRELPPEVTEEPKKKKLAGPARPPLSNLEIAPDGTVRTIRSRKDVEELNEELRDSAREHQEQIGND